MDYRISKLREYLIEVLRTLTDKKYPINADMLSDKVDNYSIDKLPTMSVVERWITGTEIHQDTYSFRSRMNYSQDTINNLKNVGFFEDFQKTINSNNKKGVLPDIENIQSIECPSAGTINNIDGTTAEFDIQIQIRYMIKGDE